MLFFVVSLALLGYNCKTQPENDLKPSEKEENSERERLSVKIDNKEKELKFSFAKVSSDASERKFIPIKMDLKFKIGGITSSEFNFPGRIKTDDNDNIYVMDFKFSTVKKYDYKGNLLAQYGRKGKGPGEFIHAFDYDVTGDGKIAILGPDDFKFSVFDADAVNDYKTKYSSDRLSFLNEDEVVISQFADPITSSPLQKHNLSDNKITNYQNIFDIRQFEDENYGMLPFLLGDILRYNDNIIHLCKILGYVIRYNKYGNITKAFKLIEEYDNDFTPERKGGNIKSVSYIDFPSPDQFLYYSVYVHKDNLYVYCNKRRQRIKRDLIDIYSLSQGVYKYSVAIQGIANIREVTMTSDMIYITKEDTEIEVYSYEMTIK